MDPSVVFHKTRTFSVTIGLIFSVLVSVNLAQARFLNPKKSKIPQLQKRTKLEILQMLVKSKRWDQAERVATKLVRKSVKNGEVFMLAGLVQFQKADYEKAIPLFKKAEVLRPDFLNLSKYLAICYFSIKQHALFELQIEQAMIQKPMDPELSFFWGLHQALVRKNLNDAIKAFDHAIKLRPQYIQALYHRGLSFQKKGLRGKARADFQKSISLIEQTFYRNYSYPYQGMARLLAEETPKQALRFAIQSIELQPLLKNNHILVGEIHWRLGQFEEATEAFKDASLLDPSDKRPHYWLHLLYQKLGEKQKSNMALIEFRRLNKRVTFK